MTYTLLVEECATNNGIGPRFYELLIKVATRVVPAYRPEIFNGGETWSTESVLDLVHDVVVDRLMQQDQLEYVLDNAADENELSALLAHQVRRVLTHRRTVTVVDRLIQRVSSLINEPRFEVIGSGEARFVSVGPPQRQPMPLPERELRAGALAIDVIPRLASSPQLERESKVYHGKDLEQLVATLAELFGGITVRDIRKILEITLTGWLPTILPIDEAAHVSGSSPEDEADRSEMNHLVMRFADSLEPTLRTVLLGKANGMSDGKLAEALGRSRPWIADQKYAALELVETELFAHVPAKLHADAGQLLLDRLTTLELEDD